MRVDMLKSAGEGLAGEGSGTALGPTVFLSSGGALAMLSFPSIPPHLPILGRSIPTPHCGVHNGCRSLLCTALTHSLPLSQVRIPFFLGVPWKTTPWSYGSDI